MMNNIFRNEKIPCHALPQVNLKAWKDGDQICQFRGIAMGVGESHLPTPCTSCICTPQGVSYFYEFFEKITLLPNS